MNEAQRQTEVTERKDMGSVRPSVPDLPQPGERDRNVSYTDLGAPH